MKLEQLGCREPLIKPEIFGKEADPSPDFNAPGSRSEDERFAAARFHKSEKHLDRSAFPRAIRTQETKDLPSAHR